MHMIRVSAIALLIASCASGAMAAPPPTDWSGFYAGVLGGKWNEPYFDVQGVAGMNFMPSEMFLLGIEGSVGGYFPTGGGSFTPTATISGRAGVVFGPAAIFATIGGWTNGSNFAPFAGGGVEFMATDNLSFRAQATVLDGSDYLVSAGLFWHMH